MFLYPKREGTEWTLTVCQRSSMRSNACVPVSTEARHYRPHICKSSIVTSFHGRQLVTGGPNPGDDTCSLTALVMQPVASSAIACSGTAIRDPEQICKESMGHGAIEAFLGQMALMFGLTYFPTLKMEAAYIPEDRITISCSGLLQLIRKFCPYSVTSASSANIHGSRRR